MFDIEEKMEAIPDTKTKKLFEEVYSSYQHGNYRSAIVMLWSVVIADIIFKLKFLEDTYRNKKAITVLKQIKEKQEEKPESPEWEKDLLKKANEELKFITLDERINLEYLHTQRNLSAHPVLTDDNLLLTPNKDTTRSLIRNAMEAILLKTALLHKELVDSIVTDLANNKDRLISYENIKPYIQKRYFPNISNDGAIKLLKALWRFIFDPRNKDEQDNINANINALVVFFERYENIYIKEIENNSHYYQVSSNYIEYIILFLSLFPKIYQVLDDAVKTLIYSSINTLDKFIMCDYLSLNLEEHYKIVIHRLNSENLNLKDNELQECYMKAKNVDILDKFFNICIKKYAKSINFNDADANYVHYIAPFLSEYSLNDIILLIKETNDKSQVCNRGQAYYDHKFILKKFYELGGMQEQLQPFSNWLVWNIRYKEELKKEEDKTSE